MKEEDQNAILYYSQVHPGTTIPHSHIHVHIQPQKPHTLTHKQAHTKIHNNNREYYYYSGSFENRKTDLGKSCLHLHCEKVTEPGLKARIFLSPQSSLCSQGLNT